MRSPKSLRPCSVRSVPWSECFRTSASNSTPRSTTRSVDMVGSLSGRQWPDVGEFVEAYESSMARDGQAELCRKMRTVAPGQAELRRDLGRTDPSAAERLADALASFPPVGGRFLGFRLCGELGQGALGRVYLARQGDLANRLVALKVSADVSGETQVLAQLQHTNVIPVYSVHRSGLLQAVCMPYLGATTLAHTLA